MEIINSIEAVSDSAITINQISYSLIWRQEILLNPFLQSLSTFTVVPNVCSKSLLTNIYEYTFSGNTYDSYWLSTTKIDYNVCETCRKQEYQFHYDYDFSAIVLLKDNRLCSTRQPKLIEFCSKCEKLHCIHHACKT